MQMEEIKKYKGDEYAARSQDGRGIETFAILMFSTAARVEESWLPLRAQGCPPPTAAAGGASAHR